MAQKIYKNTNLFIYLLFHEWPIFFMYIVFAWISVSKNILVTDWSFMYINSVMFFFRWRFRFLNFTFAVSLDYRRYIKFVKWLLKWFVFLLPLQKMFQICFLFYFVSRTISLLLLYFLNDTFHQKTLYTSEYFVLQLYLCYSKIMKIIHRVRF